MTALTLAVQSIDPRDTRSIFLWSGVLVVLILIAFGAYSYYKRWMTRDDGAGGDGFSLSDLRAMHKSGQISAEEFEKTRAGMMAAAKRMTASVPAIMPRPVAGDARADESH